MQSTWIELKIQLSNQEYAKLKSLAVKSNREVASIAREILSRYLETSKDAAPLK